ncbi:MAG TPA: nucleoside-diphosphate kinase, partial [Sphingobium sp.]|nr:nucleoside-diphosphate kinase [Sphingobium sp.]
MSVAFRRESDEEHLEPIFEIPLPPGPNWVTARGLRLTREKVEALEAVETEGMAEEEAKKLKRELRYWRTRLATAELRPVPDGQAVAFGARVT